MLRKIDRWVGSDSLSQSYRRCNMRFEHPSKHMDSLTHTNAWSESRGELKYDWQSCKHVVDLGPSLTRRVRTPGAGISETSTGHSFHEAADYRQRHLSCKRFLHAMSLPFTVDWFGSWGLSSTDHYRMSSFRKYSNRYSQTVTELQGVSTVWCALIQKRTDWNFGYRTPSISASLLSWLTDQVAGSEHLETTSYFGLGSRVVTR